jgi:maleylacetate reductase
MRFIYQCQPARVIFGRGSLANVKAEAEHLGRRALILTTPEQRNAGSDVAARLGDIAIGQFSGAVMHVPVETVAKAIAVVDEMHADLLIAIGGGSTTGLAKGIALQRDMPSLAIPTTFAGSEMTPIWGLTEAGAKRTGRDTRVLPRTVIYDPDLLRTLPAAAAVTSGMNAIAHCAEALYAIDANPITDLMAEEGIRALAQSLPKIVARADDMEAKAEALYGAWLGGSVLGSVAMALHHKLCHTLGGAFNLPHAELHTAMLPHALAYNAAAVPEAMRRISRALGAKDAAQGMFDLAKGLGAKMALRDLGMPVDGIAKAAAMAAASPYPNPRPIDEVGIRGVIEQAVSGNRPSSHIPHAEAVSFLS